MASFSTGKLGGEEYQSAVATKKTADLLLADRREHVLILGTGISLTVCQKRDIKT